MIMTTAVHEDESTRSCPEAQGYAITPHGAHVWTDDQDAKHCCEGAH